MAKVWPLQLRPTSKSVLISLADQANDEGVCWPSVRTMITRTCLSERAVQGAIKELVELGHLEARERSGRSTVYRVIHLPPQDVHPRIPDTPARAAPPPPHDVHPTPAGGAPHPRTTCTQNRNRTVKEPSVEPPPPADAVEGAPPRPVDKAKRAAPGEKERKNLPERAEGMATWEPTPVCRKWVRDHGYEPYYALHLETFRAYMLQPRNFKRYVDGDAAFRTCVLSDWGHVRSQALRARLPGVRPPAIEPGEKWWRTTGGIKAKGVELKVGDWEVGEFWRYEERVFAAAGEGPWLDPVNLSDSRIARVRALMAENAREKTDEAA